MSAKQAAWEAARVAGIAGQTAEVGDCVEIMVGPWRGALLDLVEIRPSCYVCETSTRQSVFVSVVSNGQPGIQLYRKAGQP